MNDPSKFWEDMQRSASLPDSGIEVYFDENGEVEFEMELSLFSNMLKDWLREDGE
tara:strand:- start:3535 stop:3699 length:165 start_codon:yes stop_codon:yes gene_type:complete